MDRNLRIRMSLNSFILILAVGVVMFLDGAESHAGHCPVGFIPHKGSCFWFSKIKGSFAEAGHVCHYMQGHLAKVMNRGVNDFLRNHIIRNRKGSFYYLGGSDLRVEGHWTWEGTGKAMKYQNWNPGQPSNWGGNEHCMGIDKNYANQWNDCPCEDRHNFICEI